MSTTPRDCPFPTLGRPTLTQVKTVMLNQYGVELDVTAGLVSFRQTSTGVVVRKPESELTLWGAFRLASGLRDAAMKRTKR